MNTLIEMSVDSVRLHAPTRQHVIVLREQAGARYLPVWCSSVEAGSVSRQLRGQRPERPLSHDLLASVVEAVAMTLEKAVVVATAPAVQQARLEGRVGERRLCLDARPADAVALAMRLGCAIFAEPQILEAEALLRPDGSSPVDDKLAGLRDIVNSMDLPPLGGGEAPE